MPRTTLAERLERAASRRARVQQEETYLKTLARKARMRRLIALGELVMEAGLDQLSDAALTGAFAHLAKLAADAATLEAWEAASATQPARGDGARIVAIARFNEKVAKSTADQLRELGFRWNRLLSHWEGKVDVARAQPVVQEAGGTLTASAAA